jgi:23S rRNA (guanine745-N1)-methyltransferase
MMTVKPFLALACPLDGATLKQDDQQKRGAWRCASGHSFDVAKQGYVHLLPVQKKRSKDPGDSKEMVAARQRFLNAGYYQPIADAVNTLVLKDLPANATCLDAGCGEGYYLRQLARSIPLSQSLAILGVDISKWAILSAAKQDKFSTWVVGSNANLPVESGSLDCMLCMFGFPVYSEFARALKPGGKLIQVDVGPDHLLELREIIYPQIKPHRSEAKKDPDGFFFESIESVQVPLNLTSSQSIADLLTMTPHLYKASAEGREKAAQLKTLCTRIDVQLICYRRVG